MKTYSLQSKNPAISSIQFYKGKNIPNLTRRKATLFVTYRKDWLIVSNNKIFISTIDDVKANRGSIIPALRSPKDFYVSFLYMSTLLLLAHAGFINKKVAMDELDLHKVTCTSNKRRHMVETYLDKAEEVGITLTKAQKARLESLVKGD